VGSGRLRLVPALVLGAAFLLAAGPPVARGEDAGLGEGGRPPEMVPAEPEATGEAAAAAAPADRPAYPSVVERAWFGPGADLAARAARTRAHALQVGARNVEAAARALVSPAAPGAALANALLAVRLAPDLPMAHMALARAQWQEGERRAALASAFEGLLAIPRHLEASLWLLGSLLMMLAAVLVVGSLALVFAVGSSVFSHAAHDVGDLLSRSMPGFARAALLGSLILVPLLLGEGLLGLTVAFFALGMLYGGARHRMALVLAAMLIVLGMFPVTRLAGIALTALESDPVADATFAVVQGSESRADRELLERVAEHDAMARYALALLARRAGRNEEAEARYVALLEEFPRDPGLLANLANLRFERGETEDAVGLYERAEKLVDSPIVLFDLSQAYARLFRMEEFESTLKRAQALGAETVEELSQSGDPSFVADLPFPMKLIHARLVDNTGVDAFAYALTRRVAPGHLGQRWSVAAATFGAVALAAFLLAGRYEHSSRCSRCGRRICARCDGTMWNSEICDGCHRLFHRPETTDPRLRMARLTELRAREASIDRLATALSLLVPGASGLFARRPDLAFTAILLFSWLVVSVAWRDGVVPDPLAVGGAGPLAFLLTGALALLGYLTVVLLGLVIRRSQ
jgi:tetratricopeptide (TPR) repeat protein